jgi:hypothetical protein
MLTSWELIVNESHSWIARSIYTSRAKVYLFLKKTFKGRL